MRGNHLIGFFREDVCTKPTERKTVQYGDCAVLSDWVSSTAFLHNLTVLKSLYRNVMTCQNNHAQLRRVECTYFHVCAVNSGKLFWNSRYNILFET
jgi:hypothetical protein